MSPSRPSCFATVLWLAAVLTPTTTADPRHDASDTSRPKLVLMITIDQLRGDMLPRYEKRFEAGLERLMKEGLLYTNAHYPYATTFTAVGHATLATGASPIDHGIVGNQWFEPGLEKMYCVQDAQHGQSPRNLTSTTIGDELIMATAGKARAFSISVKDRAAILPGGQLGKAFWYDRRTGSFITSRYYYDAAPSWLNDFNAGDPTARWVGKSWTLLHDVSSYVYGAQDDRAYEIGGPLGNTFPHPLGETKGIVQSTLRATPFGDELLLEAARALMIAEEIGQRGSTDFLAISFSASDYVGHAFGPNSLEAEDNLLRLDRTLGKLLSFVDEQVGLDRTAVVLSSDHGVDAIPAHRRQVIRSAHSGDVAPAESDLLPASPRDGTSTAPPSHDHDDDFCQFGGRLAGFELMKRANAHLREQLGTEHDIVAAYSDPGFYLDLAAIDLSDVGAIETMLADFLIAQTGVARVFTRTALANGTVPGDAVAQRVLRSFHPKRSANVAIVQDQGWYLWERMETTYAAMHGSPYSYDTHVPILIRTPGGPTGRTARAVTPQDIAPTLAQILGILSPTGCSGEPLVEALPSSQR